MLNRNEILDYLVNKFKEITTANGYNTNVVTVSRQYKPIHQIDPVDLPAIFVIDGKEDREYQGNRVIANFDVIIRGVVYDEDNVSEEANNLLQDITKLLKDDLRLNCLLQLPLEIDMILTDEGYLTPYSVIEVHINIKYTWVEYPL